MPAWLAPTSRLRVAWPVAALLLLALIIVSCQQGNRTRLPPPPAGPAPLVEFADGDVFLIHEGGRLEQFDDTGSLLGALQLATTAGSGDVLGLAQVEDEIVVVRIVPGAEVTVHTAITAVGPDGAEVPADVDVAGLSHCPAYLRYSIGEVPVEEYQVVPIAGQVSAAYTRNTGEELLYFLRLDGFFDGDATHEVTFDGDVRFVRYADGSAWLTGTVQVNSVDTHEVPTEWVEQGITGPFALAVEFEPVDHPGYYDYYRIVPHGGELVRIADPTDRVDLVTFPADGTMPFQIGFGANQKNAHFGASGWLNYSHVVDGAALGCLSEHTAASDFLMDLVLVEDPGRTKGP